MRLAKEGTPISGRYTLTELGARKLNSSRDRELKGLRATALEKMADAYTSSDGHKVQELMKMDSEDAQEVFEGRRKTPSLEQIKILVKRGNEELEKAKAEDL